MHGTYRGARLLVRPQKPRQGSDSSPRSTPGRSYFRLFARLSRPESSWLRTLAPQRYLSSGSARLVIFSADVAGKRLRCCLPRAQGRDLALDLCRARLPVGSEVLQILRRVQRAANGPANPIRKGSTFVSKPTPALHSHPTTAQWRRPTDVTCRTTARIRTVVPTLPCLVSCMLGAGLLEGSGTPLGSF